MRTTLDIAEPILRDLRKLQAATGKSLGALASELLAQALATHKKAPRAVPFRWTARPLGALVDVADKEALYRILDDSP